MADERIVHAIVEKCDFLYDDALLSQEMIIKKYLTFFARQFNSTERTVSFAFHTGSLCFDVVSIAALMIGCLAYEFPTNDEILAGLELDDMVLYKGERYRWGGIHNNDKGIPSRPKGNYMTLFQDAKGKNGLYSSYVPYERNKHLIKPYFGTSSVTDGRGIRRVKTNRSDFISSILDIPVEEVPSALDLSVVVVSDKSEFIEIINHLKIRYDGEKTVEMTDVVPVAYYTGTGEQIQIGKNTAKAEPVIKVTSRVSAARDLVLDKHGNKVVGLMVLDTNTSTANLAELNDLLRRKNLKFAYVSAPYTHELCELAMERYESANIFACTKEVLSKAHQRTKISNKLTRELHQQIDNILTNEVQSVMVSGYWNWAQYKSIKEKLYTIKQSAWAGEERDNFILSSMALINLFSSAFFTMSQMENEIGSGKINLSVISPEARIAELMEIATKTVSESIKKQCYDIATTLLETYTSLHDNSPKGTALFQFLRDHRDKKIAVVVPKAYYVEIFDNIFRKEYENVICVTANRFDKSEQYDIIVATGDYTGKRFNAIQCYSAPKIIVFLYDYEEKTFSYKKRNAIKSERKLDARIKGLTYEDTEKGAETSETDTVEVDESTWREFSDLDEFVDTMGSFDVRKLSAMNGGSGDYTGTAEVKYVGTFTTGEQILFSKFYSAVVLNQEVGTVVEKNPDKLLPGDILVFTKRNDYTSNIVDQIFEQLLREKKLSSDVLDAAEKAFYWKAALKEYKDSNDLSYKAVTEALRKYGSSLQEVSIRQWLIEESHIIGPRDLNTMKIIAEVTQDPYILSDPNAYHEACRIVRHYRREILSLIAKAINDKLSNKPPAHGSAFEVVYENVEKLSETMELENVFELDEVAVVNSGIVNRPISETEVLL